MPDYNQMPPQYTDQGYGEQPYYPQPQKPDNHLAWAILCTLFCCWPCGIVSIIYASKVDTKWLNGQYDRAYEYSKKAKVWAFIGTFGLLIFAVVLAAIMVVSNMLSSLF